LTSLADILAALGIGAAVGLRAPIAGLATVVLARTDTGVDFDATDWSWLESPWVAVALFLAAILLYNIGRSRPASAAAHSSPSGGAVSVFAHDRTLIVGTALAVVASVLFGSAIANSLLGGVAAVAGSVLGALGPGGFFTRAQRRASGVAAALVVLVGDLVALTTVVLVALVHALGALAALAATWLWWRARSTDVVRPGGLRILR